MVAVSHQILPVKYDCNTLVRLFKNDYFYSSSVSENKNGIWVPGIIASQAYISNWQLVVLYTEGCGVFEEVVSFSGRGRLHQPG